MSHDAHALHAQEVTRRLDVDQALGIRPEHIAERRARHGPNVLPQSRSRPLVRMALDQLTNVIVLLLGVAAVISWLTGDRLQAIAIVVVLVINAVVGFATEWQAGRALDALRKQTLVTATVRRGGQVMKIPAEELIVGDIVLVAAGDRVPADLRVIESAALRAEESSLTGESHSVSKSADPVPVAARVAERSSMLYLGTVITAGRGTAVVVATGTETELGRIGRLVTDIDTTPTNLQRRLEQLGRRVVYLVLAIAGVVTVTGVLRGDPMWEMVEVGISLAVAAVPEALPAVTTFILAFGVLRMARRHAIVRRLSAVETLGSTTVICSDKTGTLTLNRMVVTEFRLLDGTVIRPDADTLPDAGRDAVMVSVLCNDATLESGDPTEQALLVAAESLDIDVAALRSDYPRQAEHPFDSRSKRMITVHRRGDDLLAAMKGAPSVVIAACALGASDRARLLEVNREIAGRGLRVLALARKRLASAPDALLPDYTFLGFVGMVDPPRVGVMDAIAVARTAGIRVMMLTGDQIETATAIARQLDLAGAEPRVRHASEIDGLTEVELAAMVATTDVFARVSPEEKYRIVDALQRSGEIVAVTGDGVNDAPALKKADVGVAMGERGTEVAKEAADIVLADDNFATIVAAVEGGRTIYGNIGKFVHMMFSHNLNEVLTIFIALVAGWPLPLLPLQILWLNLATDVFPAFALALEPPAADVMQRQPRRSQETLLSGSLLWVIAWQAAVLAVISLTIYGWALRTYGEGAQARTLAMLALIGVQIGQTFNCRSRTRFAFDGALKNPHLWFATATVIALQATVSTVPSLARVLGIVRPAGADMIVFMIAIAAPIVFVDLQKAIAAVVRR